MRYVIETVGGDEMPTGATELDVAVERAISYLEDDPELGSLEIYDSEQHEYVKTITHGPDAHWNSVVVVLDPGEKVQAPGYVPRQITDEDAEAYERGSYKRAAVERQIGEWI